MKTSSTDSQDRNSIDAFFAGLAFAAAAIGILVAAVGAVLLITTDPYAERLLVSGSIVGVAGAMLFAFIGLNGRKEVD
ncbi:MAG: hypothetical protein AAF216_07300 [Pseudomonadota bacterium]